METPKRGDLIYLTKNNRKAMLTGFFGENLPGVADISRRGKYFSFFTFLNNKLINGMYLAFPIRRCSEFVKLSDHVWMAVGIH